MHPSELLSPDDEVRYQLSITEEWRSGIVIFHRGYRVRLRDTETGKEITTDRARVRKQSKEKKAT